MIRVTFTKQWKLITYLTKTMKKRKNIHQQVLIAFFSIRIDAYNNCYFLTWTVFFAKYL